jgi:cellulose biosynthesis protein BcsQ
MKGGVGKTASAVNIAYLAANSGYKTLLCDLDPQGSSSFYLKVKPRKKHNSKTLIKGGHKIDKNIRGSDYENLDILPADISYRNLDLILDDIKKSQKQLKKSLSPLKDEYDYVVLDCPPNITLVSENIFHTANLILVPLIPTTLSIQTYNKLMAFFKEMKLKRNTVFPFFSMVEKRKKLHNDIMQNFFNNKKRFLKSTVPYSSVVENMGIEKAPVAEFNPRSAASQAFDNLWQEINSFLLKR